MIAKRILIPWMIFSSNLISIAVCVSPTAETDYAVVRNFERIRKPAIAITKKPTKELTLDTSKIPPNAKKYDTSVTVASVVPKIIETQVPVPVKDIKIAPVPVPFVQPLPKVTPVRISRRMNMSVLCISCMPSPKT